MLSYGDVWLLEPTAAEAAVAAQITAREAFQFYRWRRLSDFETNPSDTLSWFFERQLKIGYLNNPWGASRWGYGHFLVDDEMLSAIRDQVYSGGGYHPLRFVMDDDVGTTIVTNLFMLPAVPLKKIDLKHLNLYLITLVDDRFFWYERGADIEVDEGTTTWNDVYTAIADGLGITLTVDPISADYLKPSHCLTKKYQYLPMLLDLVASSVGQRIVRTLDGKFYARNATTAKSIVLSQEFLYRKYAGGQVDLVKDGAGNVPDNVLIRYPRADSETIGNDVWTQIIGLSGLGLSDYSGVFPRSGTHMVHDTAVANFTSGPNPVNVTELTALSQRIAKDFYLWRLASIEARYEKTVPWIADGMHDIEWCHGSSLMTSVHRSEWEPEFGMLLHAGTYGADACDCCDKTGPQLRIATGTLLDGVYDANLIIRNNDTESWTVSEAIWSIDLSGSASLTASSDYLCHLNGAEPHGPYYVAIVSSTGAALTDTSKWIKLLSDPADILAYVPSIVDAVDIANGSQTIVSDSSPTDFSANVDINIIDSDNSITQGFVLVVGTDANGNPTNDVIDISNGGTLTYTTTAVFKVVTTVFVFDLIGEAAGDTIQVVINEYPVGVMRTDSGDTFLTIMPTASAPAGPDWIEVVPSDRGGYSATTTYSAGDYVQEVRRVFAIESAVRAITSNDGSVTIDNSIPDRPDLSVPPPGTIQIINIIDINEFNTFEENTLYFNIFDQTIYINVSNTWIQFCPCGSGSSSGSGSGSSGGGGGGTIVTDCCGNLLPDTLTATVSGGCLAGTYSLNYSGGSIWTVLSGSVPQDCDGFGLTLTCKPNGKWQFGPVASFCGPDVADGSWDNVDSLSCDPLLIQATGTAKAGTGGSCGSMTITITE